MGKNPPTRPADRFRHNLWVSGRAALYVVTSWLWISASMGYAEDGRLSQHRSRAIRGVRLDSDHAIEVVHEHAQHPRVDSRSLSIAPPVATVPTVSVPPVPQPSGLVLTAPEPGHVLAPITPFRPARGPPSSIL